MPTPYEQAALSGLQEYLDLSVAERQFLLGEAGLIPTQRQIPIAQALEQATPAERDQYQRQQADLAAIKERFQGLQQAGVTGGAHDVNLPGSQTVWRASPTQMAGVIQQREREMGELERQLTMRTAYEKTPERLAQEEQAKRFEQLQATQYERQLELMSKQLETLESQQEAYAQQQARALEVQEEYAKRQLEALRGEVEPSEFYKQTEKQEIEKLKELAGRKGTKITGTTLEELTADSTIGQAMVRQLQERLGIQKQQEVQARILGETPLYQTGLAQLGGIQQQAYAPYPQVGPFAAMAPGIAGTLPPAVTGAGIQAATMAAQPFQFQQQLAFQQQQIAQQQAEAERARKSGLLGAGIGAAGSIIGATLGSIMLPGPGTLAGAYLGSTAGKMIMPSGAQSPFIPYQYK